MHIISNYPFSENLPCSNASLEIRLSDAKGRGVYSLKAIPALTVIEVSPILQFPVNDDPVLQQYTYIVTINGVKGEWLALGIGAST